jgi:hypothetical protein
MVYDRDERFLETIIKFPVGIEYQSLLPSQCVRLAHVDEAWSTHISIKHFSQYIPAFELLVEPLDAVHHVCANGSCTPSQTSRTIRAGGAAPGDISYQISTPTNQTNGPQLVHNAPSQGTVSPESAGFVITETINFNNASCGDYVSTYTVTDVTNGFVDTIRHTFRVC